MNKIFFLKVKDAYQKSKTDELANAIWKYKHPDMEIDPSDKEYRSWRNSLPLFLECVIAAGLGEVYVINDAF